MVDEKPNKYEPQQSLPIPTYEEATSSRPPSSQSFLGPSEISHDAERQGLLHRESRVPISTDGYMPPTVESARSSLDFLPSSGESSARNSVEGLRREMQQMEVVDPEVEQSQLGARFSKRISSLTQGLSRIRLPFRDYLPSFGFIRERLSAIPESLRPNCTMVGRAFSLFLVVLLAYLIFVSDIFSFRKRRGMGHVYNPESVRMFVQDNTNTTNIIQNLKYLTQFDHVAGTKGNYALAKSVESVFHAANLDKTDLERFDVYLNYPKEGGRRVAIVSPSELKWEARIEEDQAYSDPPRQQTLVFHGHSTSGNVTGPLVYANYGSREDFKRLQDRGINLLGAIALVRYQGVSPSHKVKAAENAGAVGCIFYSDPSDDGFVKGKPFPEGRYRPEGSVELGSVSQTSYVLGDVLSPGFASTVGEGKRISKATSAGLNKIPSIPLSWRDAQKLLQALNGHGQKLEAETGWIGGVPDVEWWTGDDKSPTVHVQNEQDEIERHAIYNVVGKIDGMEQPEKSVIVGNHRDAWCFGAADPGSGTAVFLEVVRVFGELKRLGWRPLRSIEFMSWDAAEYNLAGSTEHVEGRIDQLRNDGFAYINVGAGVTGDDFSAAASPLFEKALLRVLDRVEDPAQGKSMRTTWHDKKKKLNALGLEGDYAAFQSLAGTSSLDMRFSGLPFPHNSCYDNFRWMTEQGDPDFAHHRALGQIWALLILEFADHPLLPFDLEAYAAAIKTFVKDLETYASLKGAPRKPGTSESVFDLKPLSDAADLFTVNAQSVHDWNRAWVREIEVPQSFEGTVIAMQRMGQNSKMAAFETALLDIHGGLPGREQFKHVIFGPQVWPTADGGIFPGIRDAVDEGKWDEARKQVAVVAGILRKASEQLLS